MRPSRAGTVPWPEDVVAEYVAKGYWQGVPLGRHFLAAADAAPDAIALVDGDTRLTFHDLAARADGAALRLRDLGLRADDRVLVQLPNRWEFVVLFLACLRSGVLPVLALPAHRRHELSYLAEHAEAAAIAVPATFKGFDHRALAADIAADRPTVTHLLVSGGAQPGDVDLRELCAPAADPVAARAVLDREEPGSRDTALFLLSGGTTALPKLIARTHDDYAHYVHRTVDAAGYGPDTVNLVALPVGHNFSLGVLLATLFEGGRVVFGSPEPEQAFELVEREGVTHSGLVPAVAQRWLEHRAAAPGHDLGTLRGLMVGGSRLPDHVAARIGPELGCALQQGYGMAEGLVCLTRPAEGDEVACHTQGRPLSGGDELMVVDEAGDPVPAGEPGVLLTRGPYTPRGYYRAPEQNARVYTPDGWYRTGDIVRLRPDGNVVVEGREKDMINRGGEKVSAEEVENLALQVDGVLMAAAVAMPDAELGERVCLYVVPRTGREVRLADVLDLMRRVGVARYKLPERLVVVDALPLTGMQKVDKKALRADVEQRLAGERAVV
uniref:Acyl-CoA synthetase n=1 Tax=Streptoalloteichus sp. ATCC 53650 TaxID=756733 RepID=K4P113_9PSEU|nr:acyl-CoA synthetase [Streptoalloteichus sp. ATCC 53650]